MTTLKKVLVVDDDPVIAKSFDRVLTPKGYAVIHAADGAEAIRRLASESYDMVYTDIKMPGDLDGIEVAKRVKAQTPWLPVVIITGYGTEANEAQARRLGIAEFLKKPLSPETIEGSANLAFSSVALPAPVGEATLVPLATASRSGVGGFLRNAGLFVAAPFIALAYVTLVPFVGLGMLGWVGYRTLVERAKRR
jgi:CheY-like chemotaxis protein